MEDVRRSYYVCPKCKGYFRVKAYEAFSRDNRLIYPGLKPCGRKLFLIALKFHRIAANQLLIPLRKAPLVRQAPDALICLHPEIAYQYDILNHPDFLAGNVDIEFINGL